MGDEADKTPADPETLSKQLAEEFTKDPEKANELLQEVLRNAPPNVVETAIAQESIYSGPLPPPQMLAEFDKVHPGTAERIITLTEKEQAHRHRMQEYGLKSSKRTEFTGTLIGGFALLASIAAAVGVTIYGEPWVGAAFVAIPVMGAIKKLIDGRDNSRPEKD